MKKRLLTLLTVLCLGGLTLSAQTNTLMVANGSVTSSNVPLYGLWLDANQHNQVIYPASMLGDMIGGSITSMTFYLAGSPSWGNNYTVSLGVTAASGFASSALNSDPVTQVCTGTLSVQNGELTFNFTTPYVYNGGNLLFDITTLSASYSSGEFFGVSTSDYSSIYVYGSNPPYRQNFIPKTQFSFTGGATCLTPNNLGISNITSTSATFSWHNQSVGTNLVAVDTIGADEATLTWIPVNETTHTFTNLGPGTHYQAFVRSDCGGGDLSATNFISFYTECDATITFPWTENFEGEWISSNAFNQESYAPLCWKRYDGGVLSTGSYDFNWQPNPASDFVFEGQGSATMYSGYADGAQNDWLVTPKLALTGTQHLTFMAKSSYSWYGLEEVSVWISAENATLTAPASDTAALPGFTKIAQFNNLPTEFFLYEVSLAGYTGNRYIAFVRRDYPNNAYYLCLDNVSVEESPDCTRPSALTVDSVNTSSAILSWTSDADNFNFYYKTDDASTYTVVNNVTLSSDSTYTLENLLPGQYYMWYVEALCDDGAVLSSLLTESPSIFVTECADVTELPLTCDFEHNIGSVNFTLPTCWDKLGFGELNVYNSSYYSHSGDYALYCYASTPQVLVLPELDNTLQISNMQLTFWSRYDYMMSATTHPALIEIGVITDPTDTATFVPLDSVTSFTTSHTEYVTTLEDYTGTANHIAMRINPGQYTYDGNYYYDNSLYIDDITLELIPSCPRPESVTITNLSHNSVSLSWSSEEDGFMVYYRESGTAAYTAIDDGPLTDNFYTLTGLNSATDYDLYVTSICSDLTETPSVAIHFTTNCSPMDSLPYSCDFEEFLNSTDLPICWVRGNSSTTYPYVNTYSGVNSSNCLNFYNVNTAAMPAIDPTAIDLTEYRVTFDAYAYNPGDVLQVGVMTDPTNVNTFTTVASLAMTDSYASYEVSLASYQGNGAYVAFRNVEANSYYVDNVVLEALPDCMRPTVFSANLGIDHATISWNATGDQSAWEVAVGSAYSNPDTLPSENVTTNSYTMGNLTANTSYTIFVRTLCGSENSIWSAPFTFTTLLTEAVQLPYICNFEDTVENAHWTLVNGSEPNIWVFDTAANNTTNGMYGLYVSSDSGATNDYDVTASSAVWAYRDIQFPDADQFNISFDWRGYGESTYDYMKVFIGNPTSVNAGSYDNPSGSALLGFFNQQSTWQTENIVLDGSYANATKRLYFLWRNDLSVGTQPSAAIDNLAVTTVSCARPVAVELLANGATTVTIGITPATEFDNLWQVNINDSIFTVSDTIVTINGLTPATNYVVKANTICSANDTSAWSIPVNFMTECLQLTTVPQTWDFESNIVGISYPYVLCWHRISGDSYSQYPYVENYSDYAHDGINSLYFYNYYGSSIAIMPAIDPNALNIQNLEVSFYANTNDYSGAVSLQVGVMTDPHDASTFTNVETVSLPNVYGNDPIVVTFENYTGTGTYVAFKTVAPEYASSRISMDDVVLEEIPACPTPTAVTVTNLNMTSADISWTENGEASTWYIKFSDGTTENTVTATTNPFTVTGLTSGTAYTVQVQSDCGNSEASGWTLPTSFTTSLCDTSNQCAYTFNLTDGYGDGWNGGYIEVRQGGVTVATIGLTSGSAGTEIVNLCNGDSTVIVWFPGNYPDEVGFSIAAPDETVLYTVSDMTTYTGFGFTPNCGGAPVVTDPTVTTLAASSIAQTTATLNASITNPDNVTITAKGFEWKATTGGTYTQIAGTGTGNTFTADLTNLTPNTSYTFKAFITFDGTTVEGSELTFTTENGDTPPEPCDVPTGLTVSAVTDESITVTWDADANVNSWNIQYSAAGGTLSSATSNTNSYTINGLQPETTYSIQVQANCGDGNLSAWSSAVTGTTTTGIDSWLANSVNLYPNPAKEVVNVQCTMYNVQIEAVEVYDVYGKLINTAIVTENPTRINVSGLANGMYFVRVTTEEGMVTKTFVKK
ncbi:MAG: fibronectin type III domain-containing protein [Bacteroidales bacterium]|nr:fibronectin type III domain-containing protein [Bacteroidales bacterium]